MKSPVNVGVDISKREFETFLLGECPRGARLGSPNDPKGFAQLEAWALEHSAGQELRFCMESTGGYESGLACYLAARGYYVSVENPRRIKRFAGALGQANKTDRSDARVIALYARAMEPRRWVLSEETRRASLQLTRHRENLLEDRGRLRNRLEHKETLPQFVVEQLAQQEELVLAQIGELEAELDALWSSSEELSDELKVLTGFAGVGKLTAMTILSEMPEVRGFQRAEHWAAQAGMYPCRKESGTWRGQTRMCKAGNAHIRRILYMGATTAMKLHPVIKEFAQRLKARGRKPKQVRVACMRKLLLMCFGALRAFHLGKTPFYGLSPKKEPARA